ncbi:DUF3039 domain-containing protein [Pseudoclavibacter alba]|uniref:DUF3039 domain-containing protein n=1 Tax=Pseudoclavibacter albus TaxID=272241 RepID=A0ABT2HVF2_9MICO|nr:DUF3039 domain-containing protein [Pseudoclavibacter alba]MBN6777686.1 DUF3039 domain-containing protein [Pseudoclavibacter alba]MCT2042277.1 DUF3039 domain-containing protein [Pseudoclavibacter alba]
MSFDGSPEAPGGPDAPGGGTALLDRELEQLLNDEQLDEGDHDKFSHYVRKEKILESAVTGKPVRALCGKKWLPNSNPDRFPVCPTCKDIYENILRD